MAEQKTATKKTTTRKAAAAKTKEADHLDAPLFDSAGARQGEVRLPKLIFAEQVNTPVMHQAFVRQTNNARQGTASTKTRATISDDGAALHRRFPRAAVARAGTFDEGRRRRVRSASKELRAAH